MNRFVPMVYEILTVKEATLIRQPRKPSELVIFLK